MLGFDALFMIIACEFERKDWIQCDGLFLYSLWIDLRVEYMIENEGFESKLNAGFEIYDACLPFLLIIVVNIR